MRVAAQAFSPDGKLLAGVQPEPMPFVHVWTLDPERLLQIARHRVARRSRLPKRSGASVHPALQALRTAKSHPTPG
jgi:hypothetical protein